MMQTKPMMLDLFCGAGGAAMGYHRAGFGRILGVDHKPQPRYPFEFVQADALEFLEKHGREFDFIHASPPCQAYSVTKSIHGRTDLPNLIAPVRELLRATGKNYVIENVPGAPLEFPVIVCGLALGLGVKRHRLFESNRFLFGTTCWNGHGDFVQVVGHDMRYCGGKRWVSVYGGGAPARTDNRRRANAAAAAIAMGIDWMSRNELSQAIPPAYTEWIGRQIMASASPS